MRFALASLLAVQTLAVAGCGTSDFAGTSAKRTDAVTPAVAPPPDGGDTATPPPDDNSGDAVPAAPAPAPTPDIPPPAGTPPANNVLAPVDLFCGTKDSGAANRPPVTASQQPLPHTAPADCRGGVEFNNYEGAFALRAGPATGARAVTLEVDLATYSAPDRMRLIAVGDAGPQVVLDSCRLRTSSYADPTGGTTRPAEDSVRSYRVALPAGTHTLTFDFGTATTPTYMRVIGLCDFVPTPVAATKGDPGLRPVVVP